MLNERIATFSRFRPQLVRAEEALSKLPEDTPFSSFAHRYVVLLNTGKMPIVGRYKHTFIFFTTFVIFRHDPC